MPSDRHPTVNPAPVVRSGFLPFLIIMMLLAALASLASRDSLPVKNGEVVVEGDNWIVTNLSESSAKRYYKLGEVNAIEGFTVDPEQSVKSDTNEKNYWFASDDEASQITHYYVTGIRQPSSEIAAVARSSFAVIYGDEIISAVSNATIGGYEMAYFTAITADPDAVPDEGKMLQRFYMYLPANRNASILISVSLAVTEDMPALTEAELLEFAGRVAEGITIEQPK